MSHSVYCDETKAKGFVLVASYIPCREVARVRAVIEKLTLRHQVRIHFRREDDARKAKILDALIETGCIASMVYDASTYLTKPGRDVAIAKMTDDAALAQVQRIVVETDESVRAQDKLIIAKRLAIARRSSETSFHHMQASEEGLLAVPDTVAWCYAKGGMWGRSASSLIKEVIEL